MTVDDWTKLIAAAAAAFAVIVGALGALLVQLRENHHLINSRMDQLLEVSEAAALAKGRLEGPRDATRRSEEQ